MYRYHYDTVYDFFSTVILYHNYTLYVIISVLQIMLIKFSDCRMH